GHLSAHLGPRIFVRAYGDRIYSNVFCMVVSPCASWAISIARNFFRPFAPIREISTGARDLLTLAFHLRGQYFRLERQAEGEDVPCPPVLVMTPAYDEVTEGRSLITQTLSSVTANGKSGHNLTLGLGRLFNCHPIYHLSSLRDGWVETANNI